MVSTLPSQFSNGRNYKKLSLMRNPAMVAWFVRASGNNTGHLQTLVQIPLGAMKISNCHGLCYDPRRVAREMDYARWRM